MSSPLPDRTLRDALQPITQTTSTFGTVSQAFLAPFTGVTGSSSRNADHSTKILTGRTYFSFLPHRNLLILSSHLPQYALSGPGNPVTEDDTGSRLIIKKRSRSPIQNIRYHAQSRFQCSREGPTASRDAEADNLRGSRDSRIYA
jgi:hypothetical protein